MVNGCLVSTLSILTRIWRLSINIVVVSYGYDNKTQHCYNKWLDRLAFIYVKYNITGASAFAVIRGIIGERGK